MNASNESNPQQAKDAVAHTPGPWQVGFSDGSGPTYIVAGDHAAVPGVSHVVTVVGGSEDSWGLPQGVRNSADACLIAAAPDLLCELKRLVRMLEPVEGVLTVQGTLKGAHAAIAKAEGR